MTAKFLIKLILLTLFCASTIYAQIKGGVEKLVETENAFAKAVAEKGIKPAFLEFLADDGIMFLPAATNGKES